jgi:Spy/CpxP family protein refolding chaperone
MILKKRFLPAVAMVLLLVGTGFAQVNRNRMADRPGAQSLATGFERLFEARQFIAGLNLTEDQRAQVRTILTNFRTPILQATRDTVKARLDMVKGVQGAATGITNAQLEVEQLKTEILEKIKTILTPDQLDKLAKREQLREQRLQKLVDALDSKLGK